VGPAEGGEADLTCWTCEADVAPGAVSCPSCKKIQPVARTEDHFSLLGLAREFAIDGAHLARRFRELSRQVHPDRFARAGPKERRISLERATRLNDSHRAIEDWRLRAAYLLKLAGIDVFAEGRTFSDPEFLEEQLEWREELALARADGDGERLRRVAADARERLRGIEADVARRFADERWFSDGPLEIALRLSRARYYDNIVADAERAGGSVDPGGA